MKTIYILFIAFLLASIACSEKSPNPKTEEDPPVEEPQPSLLELLTIHWDIDTAIHDGNYDASSTGKHIQFFAGGNYDFNGDLQGTWRFTPDSAKIIIDEGLNYQQDWTITDLSETRFEADFKSPFTRKDSKWIMHPRS